MIDEPIGRLLGPRERPVIEHRRRLAAAPGEVWAAWTRPVGGTLAVTLTPDGPAHTVLLLRHALAPAPNSIADLPQMGAGWDGYLTGLATVLAGGDDAAVVAAELSRFRGTQAAYGEQAGRLAAVNASD